MSQPAVLQPKKSFRLWVIHGLDHQTSLKFIYNLMLELQAMKDRKTLLLSGGQQKMAALGRALMAGTKLLALDEPFEGVAPALAARLVEVIGALRNVSSWHIRLAGVHTHGVDAIPL